MKKSLYDFCIENNRIELLTQWDTAANGDTTPWNISFGSGRKTWWHCENGHTWQAVVNSRSRGCGCPVCAGKNLLDGQNDLATEMPALAAQWHPEKNKPLTPAQVRRGSHAYVWWQCTQGHEWKATVKSRAEGNGCPICAGRKLLVGINDLATLYPLLAQEWHVAKNGILSPDTTMATSTRRVWWLCEKGHAWQASVLDRTKGKGCPVCSGQKVLAGENDLAAAYPLLAAQWHPTRNGGLTPQQVSPAGNRRVWWQCSRGHEWQATIYSRAQEKTDCPYCTNRKVLQGFNDLATVEPKVAKQWHPTLNGTMTPAQVTAGSRKRAWWICPEGHVWRAVIYSRTGQAKKGCPICNGSISPKQRERYQRMEEEALHALKK